MLIRFLCVNSILGLIPVTALVCRMKSGPRRSVESVHDFNIQKTLKQNNKRESEQFCQAKTTKQKTRSHKTQKEKLIYDPQSETKIDSCL